MLSKTLQTLVVTAALLVVSHLTHTPPADAAPVFVMVYGALAARELVQRKELPPQG